MKHIRAHIQSTATHTTTVSYIWLNVCAQEMKSNHERWWLRWRIHNTVRNIIFYSFLFSFPFLFGLFFFFFFSDIKSIRKRDTLERKTYTQSTKHEAWSTELLYWCMKFYSVMCIECRKCAVRAHELWMWMVRL